MRVSQRYAFHILAIFYILVFDVVVASASGANVDCSFCKRFDTSKYMIPGAVGITSCTVGRSMFGHCGLFGTS